jgi:NitT/TauT family transport system permease protein
MPPPFLLAAAVSLRRILIGFGIALLLGTSLGLAVGRSKLLEDTIGVLLVGLGSVPSVAYLPVALVWFGLNDRAIIFVVVIGSTLPIAVSVESGVRSIPPLLLRAALTLGATGPLMFRHVTLPAIVPSIVAGMRGAWAFAWRSLMAGELLISTVGLGQVLMRGRETMDMSQVLAVILIIGALGYAVDNLIFRKLETRVRRKWGLETA